MTDKRKLSPGIYRHFKGHVYEVLFMARYSEQPERELVIYKSAETGEIWARPLEMFLEEVARPEYSGPRFTYLGPAA